MISKKSKNCMEFNIKKFKLMRICKKGSPFLSDQSTRKYSSNNRIVAREPGPKKSKLSFSISLACFDQFPFFFRLIFGFPLLYCEFGMTFPANLWGTLCHETSKGIRLCVSSFILRKRLPHSNLHWLAWNGSWIKNVKGRKEEKIHKTVKAKQNRFYFEEKESLPATSGAAETTTGFRI